jgi:Flp pilus assembly pilin Flp
MSTLPRRFISVNTGSSALSCGLIVAIAAVAIVVGIARYDLTRPLDHPMFLKLHSQSDRVS